MLDKILVETHCHTLASSHAYSTVAELATYAKKIGLEAISITDHAPDMYDSPHMWHFSCERFWPPIMEGMRVFSGAELNIKDANGGVDIEDDILADLDVVIASAHQGISPDLNFEEMTESYLSIIQNPNIDILGHSGTPHFSFDIEKVVKAAAKEDKIMEINNHSFGFRQKSIGNCIKIAKAAKKFGMKIAVSTDAHICYELGNCSLVLPMLEEIDFPEELIVNRTLASFESYQREHKTPIK